MDDLLRVRNLHVSITLPRSEVEAVRGADFRIRPGSTVALVGESGSGKSITAYAIMGLLPQNAQVVAGEILFRDPKSPARAVDLASLDPAGAEMRAIRGGRISMVFQEPMTSLSPLHTIGDQIGEALRFHHGCGGGECRARTEGLLRRVGFKNPARSLSSYPFELSGGLRQRAMIAMALICSPALLIADEPTTALDVTIQAQILKLIAELQREFGMAVLIITHDLGVVANLAEEIVVMYRGEVVESGTREAIFGDPQHPYLKALFDAVPRFGLPPGERLKPLRESRSDAAPQPATPQAQPCDIAAPARVNTDEAIIEIRNLRKAFTRRRDAFAFRASPDEDQAVDGVSLSIRQGESLGLVGESGSGKTTLSKLIMRAMTPDAGELIYRENGRDVDVLSLQGKALAAYRRAVQYIFQDPYGALNPRMTVQELVTEPLTIQGIGTPASRMAAARALLCLVGLDERYLNRYPHSFSGGQRQRIGIARALALKPRLLICDEPVSALDVGIQAQILNLLKDLQAELGLTYLFVTHNLAVVNYIADRIAVMCRGKIVELAPKTELFRRPLHPYTRNLLAAIPDASLDCRLNFEALADDAASRPEAWPMPYRKDGGTIQRLHDVGGGHFVLAAEGAAVRELCA
jgi:peptide/nickel transport system ATP-binding protein